MEVFRQKNVATRIVFPIVDADGDFVTAATGLDSEIDTFADGTNPDGFTDCTNEATEIGTTGIYYLVLTAAEVNVDYAVVQVKTTSSGAKTQMILINTLFAPKADANGRVDVGLWLGSAPDALSSGKVPADLKLWLTTAPLALSAQLVQAIVADYASGKVPLQPTVAGRTLDVDASGGTEVGSIQAGAIGAAAFAAGAIDAAALAQGAAQEVADEVLNRNLAGGGSGNTRNVRNALRALRNKVSETGGTLTVTEEDDTTAAWTAAVVRTAGDPITSVDPA